MVMKLIMILRLLLFMQIFMFLTVPSLNLVLVPFSHALNQTMRLLFKTLSLRIAQLSEFLFKVKVLAN
jgi:hypothetical protein